MNDLDRALRHLEQGDWQAAHAIAQEHASPLGSWAHGVVHLMEGDLGNARYWYRRADRNVPDLSGDSGAVIEREIRAIRARL